jgi:pyruvate dehydrogenase E2 component (dihydrolipoamide acetyltransferase)
VPSEEAETVRAARVSECFGTERDGMSDFSDFGLSPQGVPVAEVIPLRGALKILSEHMTRSQLSYAPFTLMGEADVTESKPFWRDVATSLEESTGAHVSFTYFMVKVLAQSLRQHLMINSTLVGESVLVLADVNIGVAVALKSGFLVVPVIKQADHKSILEVAQEGMQLTDRAHRQELGLDDVTGATFTLSNAGGFGPRSCPGVGSWSTPIISFPQSAILALGAMHEAVVPIAGQIVIRTLLPTSLTVDHRIINGAPAGEFVRTINHLLECPKEIDLGL